MLRRAARRGSTDQGNGPVANCRYNPTKARFQVAIRRLSGPNAAKSFTSPGRLRLDHHNPALAVAAPTRAANAHTRRSVVVTG
jgi:hypothetical protein